MLNRLFAFTQNKCEYLYTNSLILQNIDKLILTSILAVFVFSVFANSDLIGMIASLTILLTFIKLLIKKEEQLDCNKAELFLLAYFMLVIVSLCGSSLFALSLKGFIKILIYLGFYLSIVQYLKNNTNKIWLIIFTIAGCLSYELLQGFLQTFIRPEAISTWQDVSYLNPEQVINRVYGTLKPLNPNLFGGYIVATIPTLLATCGYFITKNKQIPAVITGLFSLLSIYILFQSGCRGSYLGLFAIIVVTSLFCAKLFWENYKQIFIYAISSITLLGTALILSVTSFRARIFSIFAMRQDSSNSFRFNVYNSCIDMLKDNWLLGIGLGNQNFREIYGLYMKTGFDALSAYNIYLETAVESGIFALIAFIGFIFLTLKQAYKYILHTNDIISLLVIYSAVASVIGLLIHGFVDTVFFRPQIHLIFWTMMAIIKIQTRKELL